MTNSELSSPKRKKRTVEIVEPHKIKSTTDISETPSPSQEPNKLSPNPEVALNKEDIKEDRNSGSLKQWLIKLMKT